MGVAGKMFQKVVVVLAADLTVSMVLIRDRLRYLAVVLSEGVHVVLDVDEEILMVCFLPLLLDFFKSFRAILVLGIVHHRAPAVGSVF